MMVLKGKQWYTNTVKLMWGRIGTVVRDAGTRQAKIISHINNLIGF